MLLTYIKIALRNISRHKIFSFINIIGLAIGLAAVILIFLSIRLECSYDNFHENRDRIFRLGFKYYQNDVFYGDYNTFFAGVGPEIKNYLPDVEEYVRISDGYAFFLIHNGKAFEIDGIKYTESNFFTLFDFNLIQGNPKSALTSPDSIVLTEETAWKFFGDKNPVGEIIYNENHQPLIITGVAENPPANSQIKFNALISFSSLYDDPDLKLHWGGSTAFNTYIMLYRNAVPSAVEAKLPSFMEKINQKLSLSNDFWTANLQPLDDIHLYYEYSSSSNRKALYLYSVIAGLILSIACINFINLTTAISIKRAKEIGIRKVLGARKKALIVQFLFESVIMSLIALVIALALVELAIPKYNLLLEKQIGLGYLIRLAHILGFAALVVVTGIIAGLYPAFKLSSCQPIKILKGESSTGRPKVALRHILVVVQFAISISLISVTFLIHSQVAYMKSRDPGFDKENVVVLDLKNEELKGNAEQIKNALKIIPGVICAAASSQVPSGGFNYYGCLPEGSTTWMFNAQVDIDEDYIGLYGLDIVQGRNFDDSLATDKEKYLINESFVREVGWENPVGKTIKRSIDHEVIGVVKDFNFAPLYHNITPLIMKLQPESGRYKVVSIKIAKENIEETIERIEKVWTDFATDIPFEYFFLDEEFDQIYKSDLKSRELFFFFSTFAIFIAILGLFGLAAYTVEQRTKEIGIRKVLGASFFSIISLLARGFLLPVIIANIIAIPTTYWFMNKMLDNFAYKVNVGFGYFGLAGFIALFIAVLTITFHSVRAALFNPVKSLRYE